MIHAQNPHTIVLEPYLQNHFCKRHVPEAGFLSEIAPHVLFSSSPGMCAETLSSGTFAIYFMRNIRRCQGADSQNPAEMFSDSNINLSSGSFVFVITHTCCVHHPLGCDHRRRMFVFVTVIDHRFDSCLNDCFCTFVARKQ